MEIKTFRAKTMQAALNLVRDELGPEATVLHTRELNTGFVSRLLKGQAFEIAASAEINAPERAPAAVAASSEPQTAVSTIVTPPEMDYRARYRDHFHQQSEAGLDELHALAEQLRGRGEQPTSHHLPDTLFQVYTDMIESDIEERIAQALIEHLRNDSSVDPRNAPEVEAELVRLLESEIATTGPIEADEGQGKVVALVGPTGVGKTTTIAKLAANYRLRENKRVGLITVDTYRIAAVEQLRTYADIIDLPMEIVATPREMREAIARMSDLDLILMDTAGRSPRDEVKIQELKSMLAEAEPDEVHLVLSAVGGARSLASTAERFATVGTTAMLVTKLDEATAYGNLLSVTRSCGLPISYLTDGQNVPDDIRDAQPRELAEMIMGRQLSY
ncbi:MAG: flagellar biosynthesis protein FlhF [Planctomycetota bacterium]